MYEARSHLPELYKKRPAVPSPCLVNPVIDRWMGARAIRTPFFRGPLEGAGGLRYCAGDAGSQINTCRI